MKIRRVSIKNNPVLGSIDLNFVDEDSKKIKDTVLFLGENGSGKSTLLEVIYKFSRFEIIADGEENKERVFEVEFANSHIEQISEHLEPRGQGDKNLSSDFKFVFDCSKSGWEQITVTSGSEDISPRHFTDVKMRALFKSMFSTVGINFGSRSIDSVTKKDIDPELNESARSDSNTAAEITQAFVDMHHKDALDLMEWTQKNEGSAPTEDVTGVRMSRFKRSFNEMFLNKLTYSKISADLIPVFEKDGEPISINGLSSGEKQIVFRGGHLLLHQRSIEGAMVLIDEPEISMHPKWQKKIVNYYRGLFTNTEGEQTSQIFFATHSPYVLQELSFNDILIYVLKRKEEGVEGISIADSFSITGDEPSIGEINYRAFDVPTFEYHNELYGFLHAYYIGKGVDDEEKRKRSSISNFDSSFLNEAYDIDLCKEWTDDSVQSPTPKNVTLQTFIRNKTHHPENTLMKNERYTNTELKGSIEQLEEIVNNLSK